MSPFGDSLISSGSLFQSSTSGIHQRPQTRPHTFRWTELWRKPDIQTDQAETGNVILLKQNPSRITSNTRNSQNQKPETSQTAGKIYRNTEELLTSFPFRQKISLSWAFQTEIRVQQLLVGRGFLRKSDPTETRRQKTHLTSWQETFLRSSSKSRSQTHSDRCRIRPKRCCELLPELLPELQSNSASRCSDRSCSSESLQMLKQTDPWSAAPSVSNLADFPQVFLDLGCTAQ